jgi:hypothetical protein
LFFATNITPPWVAYPLPVSGSSHTVTVTEWNTVKSWIGTPPTYYWTVGEQYGNRLYARTSFRAFTEATIPNPPSNLIAIGGNGNPNGIGNQVELGWTDNSNNEDGFKLDRKTGSGGSWAPLTTLPPNFNAYPDTNLSFGTSYYYRVYAYNAAGPSPFSNEACGTPLATPMSTSPSNGAVLSTNSVNFQWTAVTSATAYALRVGTSCGASDILSVDPTVASYSANNLPSGTYFWRVTAFRDPASCGGLSLAPGCYSFTILLPPNPPTNLIAIGGNIPGGNGNQVLLGWTQNSDNEDGFKIDRKTGAGGSWGPLATKGANVTAHADINLTYGTSYYYRVYAYNAAGPSPFSNEACGTPLATPMSTSPSNGAVLSTNSVNFQWTAVTSATAYALRVGTSCGASDILSVDPTVASYSANNLPSGTYFWRVQAYKETCTGLSLASECYNFTISVLTPDIDVSPTTLAFTCAASVAAPVEPGQRRGRAEEKILGEPGIILRLASAASKSTLESAEPWRAFIADLTGPPSPDYSVRREKACIFSG